jgi:uncharacterized protein (UPF0335 family)
MSVKPKAAAKPGPGHNWGKKADMLASFVSKIQKLEEEIADLNGDKSEVYSEAKANGFDVNILRQVIRRGRMNTADRQKQDAILELYEKELGMR